MVAALDRKYSALVEVSGFSVTKSSLDSWNMLCSMVTEEQPHAMLIPMAFFFVGFGLYRPGRVSDRPWSPLSPRRVSFCLHRVLV
ncbi:hypothetical protein HID58_024663 [Brassica napus]|uniref:Uncharacterized protein n=2 Tax=Brassica TaxID=3705 RepID=A0A8D9HIQ2_BRACM|nr:hypothetical protein HID58_024663 [Brassica napus]CAF2156801.1 unnamed protein product [Brassica napus]CAG7900483.1 unnamed protein product [Brassica rapa]